MQKDLPPIHATHSRHSQGHDHSLPLVTPPLDIELQDQRPQVLRQIQVSPLHYRKSTFKISYRMKAHVNIIVTPVTICQILNGLISSNLKPGITGSDSNERIWVIEPTYTDRTCEAGLSKSAQRCSISALTRGSCSANISFTSSFENSACASESSFRDCFACCLSSLILWSALSPYFSFSSAACCESIQGRELAQPPKQQLRKHQATNLRISFLLV